MSKRKLLYITSVPGRRDLPPLSDATKSVLSDRSQGIGSTLLAYHEVAHSMRRLLVQVESY